MGGLTEIRWKVERKGLREIAKSGGSVADGWE